MHGIANVQLNILQCTATPSQVNKKNVLHVLTLIYEYSSHQEAMQSILYHDSFEEEGRIELQIMHSYQSSIQRRLDLKNTYQYMF